MKRARKSNGKYKLSLSIDHDFSRRFGAYCQFIGEDMSEVVVRALRREMRGFSVSRRVDLDDQPDEPAAKTIRMDRQAGGREAV